MSHAIGLLHATVNAIEPIAAAWRASAHEVALRHYVDEGLLPLATARGALDPEVLRRLEHWLATMYGDGVGAVLATCSSLTPAVASVRPRFSKPLVAIDEAMIDEALQRGRRIGVLATLPGAAATTRALLEAAARLQERQVTLAAAVASGAFEALSRGDTAAHDTAVRAAANSLAPAVDVIVLAQVSMMRVLPSLATLPIPVLTSAPGAIRRVLEGLTPAPASQR